MLTGHEDPAGGEVNLNVLQGWAVFKISVLNLNNLSIRYSNF